MIKSFKLVWHEHRVILIINICLSVIWAVSVNIMSYIRWHEWNNILAWIGCLLFPIYVIYSINRYKINTIKGLSNLKELIFVQLGLIAVCIFLMFK